MKAIVWLLIFWGGSGNGGPATVPGIATEQECQTLFAKIKKADDDAYYRSDYTIGIGRSHYCVSYESP